MNRKYAHGKPKSDGARSLFGADRERYCLKQLQQSGKGAVSISKSKARPHNERLRRAKTKKILDAANEVFRRNGFLAVTMQDIVDECGISRGGIYIYFSSVDEIFFEVIKRRNKERQSAMSRSLQDGESFERVLGGYLERQRARLAGFENSLFRAYCEYVFSKPRAAARAFSDVQLRHLRGTVASMFELGAAEGLVDRASVGALTDQFIVAIDGLGVMALGGNLTGDIIDAQLGILRAAALGKNKSRRNGE